MHPILFSIGPINFYSYGLFAAIAVICTYFAMLKLIKVKNLPEGDLLDKVVLVFIAGVVGARIGYFITYYEQFSSIWEIFYLWNGGLVSYGGIVGGFLALLFLFKKNLGNWLDIFGISFLLGSAIWRIGGYFSGGNPGIESNSLISVDGRIPIVLIESVFTIIIFLILVKLYKKIKLKSGVFFWISIGLYGLIRVAADYFRDYTYSVGVLRTGQIIGFVLFIISFIAIFLIYKYDKKKKGE